MHQPGNILTYFDTNEISILGEPCNIVIPFNPIQDQGPKNTNYDRKTRTHADNRIKTPKTYTLTPTEFNYTSYIVKRHLPPTRT